MTTATTVVHTVVTPAGRALAYAACSVRLVGPGFIGANQSEIMTSDTFTTSSTGQLSMALVPNVEIDTANTYYAVTLPDGEVWNFIVPVSGSPVSLESCLMVGPIPGPGYPLLSGTNAVVVPLTDAATITTEASLGNLFTVTLGGNRTMANPTNPISGQKLIYAIAQDATGSRTVAWGSAFRFGVTIAQPALTATPGKTDYIGFIYNAASSTFDCVAVSQGY